jgi:hypothetical protein
MADPPDITLAERERLLRSAEQYVRRVKGWRDDQFRTDIRSVDAATSDLVLWAILLEGVRHPAPGGGESFELHLDRQTAAVTKELRFQ